MPWSKQVEIAESVRDHTRTAVRSCHGAGKSRLAAWLALWFLYTHRGAVVATTAPTFRQVEKILWQEIRAAHSASRVPLGGSPNLVEIKLEDKWFAFGFSTDHPDAFQGLHARDVLVIFDEGSGVPVPIWTAAEGVLTSEHCRFLSIGNPTDPDGPFAGEFKQAVTSKHSISAYETPNFTAFGITEADCESGAWAQKITGDLPYPALVTPAWVADKIKRWGKTSPFYRSRVLGEFPDSGDKSLVPLSWIEAAQRRTLEPAAPVELAVDVARFGDDETVAYLRRGNVVRIVHHAHMNDTMETSGRTLRLMREHGATVAKIDVVGVGSGVYDRLRELGQPVSPINAGEGAHDSERFSNRRAELFWLLRERFESGQVDIDPADEELSAQLASIQWKVDSRGRVVIESKEDMKRRGLPSPDRADAVAYAFAVEKPHRTIRAF